MLLQLLSIHYFYSESAQSHTASQNGCFFCQLFPFCLVTTCMFYSPFSKHQDILPLVIISCILNDLHVWLSKDILWKSWGINVPFAVCFTVLFNIYSKFLINVQHLCDRILSCVTHTQKEREKCWGNIRTFYHSYKEKSSTHALKSQNWE